ncbi:MAG: hypothetical protein PWP23_639 [Candidatus Sumerlaeota bacterium]|nr:hypothetical protein [Candidatus Sumerlaeota bacterium]
MGPADWRASVLPGEFEPASAGEWMTPQIEAPFPYDELIYSWHSRLAEGEGFRLYLQVGFGDEDVSPWLYAGHWGDIPAIEPRENPTFADGSVAMDQLLLDRKARTWRFKAVSTGSQPLTAPPALYVVGTDNARVDNTRIAATRLASAELPILDLPLRPQMSSTGEKMPDRCQSAALAAALQYYGHELPLETIVPLCWDPEYEYPGIWPRTLGAATQLGFDGYIDRFRDWDAVRATLALNRVILVSMRMPKGDGYIAPPYSSMTGHIVALNGVTADGRVIVTDSALGESGRGYRLQWLMEDFEKVWMETKGGVGMVICPPEGAMLRSLGEPAAFPDDPERQAASGK